jgi:pyridoxine 5-phosphate synthase
MRTASPNNYLRLGVNIDHVATLRNARGVSYPDPIYAAKIAESAGADGITVHLREDRRHIKDEDLFALKALTILPINLEMAAIPAMLDIALQVRPHAVCIVPEKRAEITTEGGLNVLAHKSLLQKMIAPLHLANILVSLFVDPAREQIKCAADLGVDIIELHTGKYCNLDGEAQMLELEKIAQAAEYGDSLGLEIHAGHGLNLSNVENIAAIKLIKELNIGHALISDALFVGLDQAIKNMHKLMQAARI